MSIEGIASIVVSAGFALYTIYQSSKYNKQTSQMLEDMKYLMIRQVASLDNMNYDVEKNRVKSSGKISLKKDQIHFHKLSSFDKKDIEKIMKEIERLTIKRRFLKNIEKFLYDDDQERVISFCGKAVQFNEEKEEKEEIDFLSLYKIFLKYNISIYIK